MARIHGKSGVVMAGGEVIGSITNFSLNTSLETDDSTAMGDAAQTHVAGIPGWSGSAEANLDDEDTNGQEALSEGAEVALELYPSGNAVGRVYYSGNATITGIDINVPLGTVKRTFTFQGNGALSKQAVV